MKDVVSRTVMIADDDPTTRSVLASIIKSLGHVLVRTTVDGASTLTLCRALRPDVLFLDIQMPGLSGIEVMQALKSSNDEMAVVMITSNPTMEHVQAAIRLGVKAFVAKPFDATKISEAIARCARS
ncbi:MAG: response regulator [Gammaproteobacteria bacterium]|nr:response regulator [Gammaproteobacteria bacterium]